MNRKMKPLMVSLLLLMTVVGRGSEMVAEAVKNFDLESYLGTWYEIARLDHSFERGLTNVTANYTLKENGSVKVLNRGYSDKKSTWKSATGRAKFTDDPNVGALRVSFFWPFYGGYNVVLLAENYSYALVAGDSEKYLWILAREPELNQDIMSSLLERARELGYSTENLIYVSHEKQD